MEPEQKSNGALVGSIIIIIILIVGGIYLWKTALKERAVTPGLPEGTVEENLTTDEANNIDAELDELDLEGLDEGLE